METACGQPLPAIRPFPNVSKGKFISTRVQYIIIQVIMLLVKTFQKFHIVTFIMSKMAKYGQDTFKKIKKCPVLFLIFCCY